MFDVVVDVGEVGRTVVVGLEDLAQVEEPVGPGHLRRRQVHHVPQGQRLLGPRTVEQGAGQLLQAVASREVEQAGELAAF